MSSRNALLLSCGITMLASCAYGLALEELAQGVTYERLITATGQVAHIANIDPSNVEIKLVRAKSESGLQTVSSMASQYRALIAVNAGFFQADGHPAGAFKLNGKWISKPTKNRGLVGFSRSEKGLEIVFDRFTHDLKKTNNRLEQATNILGGAPLLLQNGQKKKFKEEKVREDFLRHRYARTAICVTESGMVKLAVFDGGDRATRAFGLNSGMTIDELAEFLLQIGCVNALNLDGGYSAAFVKDGNRVNAFALPLLPERPVGSALIVLPRISS